MPIGKNIRPVLLSSFCLFESELVMGIQRTSQISILFTILVLATGNLQAQQTDFPPTGTGLNSLQLLKLSEEIKSQDLENLLAQTPVTTTGITYQPNQVLATGKGKLIGFDAKPTNATVAIQPSVQNCLCGSCNVTSQPATCIDCAHVSTLGSEFNIRLFGSLNGEMLFATALPNLPSGIVLITPNFGEKSPTFEIHSKSTSLGAAFSGPEIGRFQSGGQIYSTLYGQTYEEDKYGIYLLMAYAELKNECERYAFGLHRDLINPIAPNTINFNQANGAGNLGFVRGQFRAERIRKLKQDTQLTSQLALSDPVTTSFTNFDKIPANLLEETAMPNIEGRLALSKTSGPHVPGTAIRFESGFSGLVGKLRRTDIPTNRIHNVWCVGSDFQLAINERLGFRSEFFSGSAIGNYNAAIFLIDNQKLDPVRSTGGWGEVYFNWSTCVRSHFGYGVDDPLNSTLSPGLPTRNEVAYANMIWDVNKSLELGLEVSHWDTSYTGPLLDNSAMVYHTRVRLKF
jgi:hypothetical protein